MMYDASSEARNSTACATSSTRPSRLSGTARSDFSRHAEKAAELEARFGMLQLARFERVLERLAWLLRLRTERHQFADAQPKLPIASNFRYHMFLQELVMDGPAAYHAYLADVALVVKRLEQSTDEQQLWALFQLELWHLMFVDRTLRPADRLVG